MTESCLGSISRNFSVFHMLMLTEQISKMTQFTYSESAMKKTNYSEPHNKKLATSQTFLHSCLIQAPGGKFVNIVGIFESLSWLKKKQQDEQKKSKVKCNFIFLMVTSR